MSWDDLEPVKVAPAKKDLEVMSIEALGEYIAELEAEILRARSTIAAKKSVRAGAEGLFKR